MHSIQFRLFTIFPLIFICFWSYSHFARQISQNPKSFNEICRISRPKSLMMRTSGPFQYSAFHEKYPESSWVEFNENAEKLCSFSLAAFPFTKTVCFWKHNCSKFGSSYCFSCWIFHRSDRILANYNNCKHVKNGEIPALKFPISMVAIWVDNFSLNAIV